MARLVLMPFLLCLMAIEAETNIRMNVRPLKGLGSIAMRLRGGADDEEMEVVEETVVTEDVAAVASTPMTRREIDAEIAKILEGPTPDFVKAYADI